jgi:hypothetical protein
MASLSCWQRLWLVGPRLAGHLDAERRHQLATFLLGAIWALGLQHQGHKVAGPLDAEPQ